MAEHSSNLSHDAVRYFLKTKKFTPNQLWKMVSPHIDNNAEGMLISDDSVQNKKYSRFTELVKRQYSSRSCLRMFFSSSSNNQNKC